MNDTRMKEIIDYASPAKSFTITGIVFAGLSPIVFFILMLLSGNLTLSIVSGASTLFVSLIMICMSTANRAAAKKQLKKHIDQFGKDAVFADYRMGESVLNESIICGHKLLFTRGMGNILAYDEITEIIHTRSHYKTFETSRNLYALLKNGKRAQLCSVYSTDGIDRRISKAISTIMKHLPGVCVTKKLI